MDNDKALDLGFKKVFDKVPHRRLLLKVNECGIQRDSVRWIRNWLAGRRQQVCINQSSSNWAPATTGVPQGCVSGPVLFVIHTYIYIYI